MTDTRRVVTPHEAQGLAKAMEPLPPIFADLAHTVATEPDRIRAAVVESLRHASRLNKATIPLRVLAQEIENGSDW